MAITVGTDTYITIADADTYAGLFYLPTEAKFLAWDAAEDSVKEILLRRATQSIEVMQYPGKKYDNDQTLSFPRVIPNVWPLRREIRNWCFVDYNLCPWSASWIESGEVPDEIKYAEVEEALEILTPELGSSVKSRTQKGVKSVGILHFSESYIPGSMSIGNMASVIGSIKARELLSKFQGGSFRVV